jgi:hypothetical protein
MRRCCVSQSWVLWTLTVAAVLMGSVARAGRAGDAGPKTLLPSWEPSATLKTALGYKDNVGLSRTAPEASAFVHTAVEGMVLRLPVDGTQVLLYLAAEDTRFWESSRLDHEDFAMTQLEVRRFWENDWQAALGLEGMYFDQLIDFSITDTNLAALPARGLSLTVRPGVRRELSSAIWLSLETPVSRQLYKDSVDDYWEGGPKLTLGRTYGRQSEVSLSYLFTQRGYNRAPGRDADGDTITNSVRRVSHHEVQIGWKHFWDAKRHWRSSTRLGYRHSAENVSGYFDYERYELVHQWRFKTGRWELSAEGRVAHYRFPVQTVSDTDPEKRRRTDLRATLRAERQLNPHLRLHAQYEYERSDSNQLLDEYAVNTVSAGVSVEF